VSDKQTCSQCKRPSHTMKWNEERRAYDHFCKQHSPPYTTIEWGELDQLRATIAAQSAEIARLRESDATNQDRVVRMVDEIQRLRVVEAEAVRLREGFATYAMRADVLLDEHDKNFTKEEYDEWEALEALYQSTLAATPATSAIAELVSAAVEERKFELYMRTTGEGRPYPEHGYTLTKRRQAAVDAYRTTLTVPSEQERK